MSDITITPVKDGPLHIKGKASIVQGDVSEEKEEVYLCRCGASKKKPECDGSHRNIGFKAE